MRRRARRDCEREREPLSEADVASDSVVVSFTGGGGPFLGAVSRSDMFSRRVLLGSRIRRFPRVKYYRRHARKGILRCTRMKEWKRSGLYGRKWCKFSTSLNETDILVTDR